MPGVVVIGAGPGIGRSVARRFAREGLPVALIARTGRTLEGTAEAVAPFGVPVVSLTADSADETGLRAALDAAAAELGPPEVVVYNAAIIQPDGPGELSARAHLDAWAVNVVGALTAAAHTAPEMARHGGGSFLITGGMPEPKRQYVSFDPDDIAEHYWRLHTQPRPRWEQEIFHDGSSTTGTEAVVTDTEA